MAKNNKYTPVTSTHVQRKEYSFQKNNVTLSFTLRQDQADEMTTFLELLEAAKTDLTKDLESIKK